MNIENLREAIRSHSSPTIGRGDVHGGQAGFIVYEDSLPYIAVALAMAETFQNRVGPWLFECFGEVVAGDREERNHRFLEEALELVQSCGCTQEDAHKLVDYVYGRPVGERHQEVGGVMVTLAALCIAQKLDMHEAGDTELSRIWTKVEQIRAKQAAKPKFGPLPGPSEPALCHCGSYVGNGGDICAHGGCKEVSYS